MALSADENTILEMFSYMRPSGSAAEDAFVDKFLTPLGFKRDDFNNLVLKVGDKPSILWSSHMDTVHYVSGMQTLDYRNGILTLSKRAKKGASSCLGADDTAGVWLMTEMIKAGVEGLYIIHHAEERGCIGSSNLVQHDAKFVDGIKAAIAFDRRGYDDVITHQSSGRTASNAFATSLAAILGGQYRPDDSGTYTDTNEYAGLIPECTNISVGYFSQHTRSERQDVHFLLGLRDTLITADFSTLVIARDPQSDPYEDYRGGYHSFSGSSRYRSSTALSSGHTMEGLIKQYPDIVADILEGQGWDVGHLKAEISSYYGGLFDEHDDDDTETNTQAPWGRAA
jgi:hypothetical protein